MRVPLGLLSVLLVILVGFLCISTTKAYYYEDVATSVQQSSPTDDQSITDGGAQKTTDASLQQDVVATQEAGPTINEQSEAAAPSESSNGGGDGDAFVSAAEPEDEAGYTQEQESQPYGKRQEGSKLFGEPKDSNAAGADQETRQQAEQQQGGLSPPANEPPMDATVKQAAESSSNQATETKSRDQQQAQDQTSSQQQQQSAANPSAPASTGRGFSDLVSGIMNPNQGQYFQQNVKGGPMLMHHQQLPVQQQHQQQQHHQQKQPLQQVQQARPPVGDIPREDLPTIIENKQITQQPQQPQQPEQPQQPAQSLQQQTSQQPQQPQQQPQQQQTETPTSGGGALVAPPNPSQQAVSTNQTGLAPSTARTFGESWTYCQGESSGKHGTCKNDVTCRKDKGVPDGTCMSGLGVCCVMALTCNDKSFENNTFFANPDFPEPSWEARLCEVEVKKKHSKILQVMIEFEEFELAPPNSEGECITDVFQVNLGSGRPSPYSLLRICGQNSGQHLYLDVSQIEEPLILSVATSGGGFPRRWSIRIVQMDEKNYLLAPPGCLQYYTDTMGHFRSFNLGRNLRNLYYAICFRIDNGYSGIRFTSNFFGMNGPQCLRRRSPSGHPLLKGGRYNQTQTGGFEAHPHHLVIPPMGYAVPPPRPRPYHMGTEYGGPTPGPSGRYKRSNPTAPVYQQTAAPATLPPHHHHHQQQQQQQQQRYSQQQQQPVASTSRTFNDMFAFGSKDNKEDKKHEHEFEHEHEHHHKHHHPHMPPPPPPSYAPNYAPSYAPSYGPTYTPTGSYGYTSSAPNYGGPPSEYGPPPAPAPAHHYPHHQPMYPPSTYEVYEHQGKKDMKFDKKDDKFGWKSDKKDDKWEWNKFGWKSDKKEEKKGGDEYMELYPRPGPGYGPGYGPPPPPPPPHYYEHHGPPPPPPGYGYGPPQYGEYHHKEIDKFGKKYEHLEHKHEMNHHMDKEDKKDAKSWWFWQKKEEKKDKKDKEKYFSHHEALFPMMRIPEMPHCEPRFCGANDVITFPPSGDSISEMCGNRFNRGRGPKIISGSPLVVYVSNRGHQRGSGFDMNYEQVFYVPNPY